MLMDFIVNDDDWLLLPSSVAAVVLKLHVMANALHPLLLLLTVRIICQDNVSLDWCLWSALLCSTLLCSALLKTSQWWIETFWICGSHSERVHNYVVAARRWIRRQWSGNAGGGCAVLLEVQCREVENPPRGGRLWGTGLLYTEVCSIFVLHCIYPCTLRNLFEMMTRTWVPVWWGLHLSHPFGAMLNVFLRPCSPGATANGWW